MARTRTGKGEGAAPHSRSSAGAAAGRAAKGSAAAPQIPNEACDGIPYKNPPSQGGKQPATQARVCYQGQKKRHFQMPTGSAEAGKICSDCKLLCAGNANGGLPGA